jgi:D-glycero-D-manno-heptose 1,7-bisphosphate phosphatase
MAFVISLKGVSMNKRPAIFLDRDGVIIEEVNYLSHPDQVKLIPGAAKAIQTLNTLGIPVIIVSNQAGVAKGYFPITQIPLVHARLNELLAQEKAHADAIYYCPHHSEGSVPEYAITCKCRKPSPGMLLEAEKNHQLDLSASWIIGDKASDVEAGINAGCKNILVRTGYGDTITSESLPAGTIIKTDLLEAVNFILLSKSSLGCCA